MNTSNYTTWQPKEQHDIRLWVWYKICFVAKILLNVAEYDKKGILKGTPRKKMLLIVASCLALTVWRTLISEKNSTAYLNWIASEDPTASSVRKGRLLTIYSLSRRYLFVHYCTTHWVKILRHTVNPSNSIGLSSRSWKIPNVKMLAYKKALKKSPSRRCCPQIHLWGWPPTLCCIVYDQGWVVRV